MTWKHFIWAVHVFLVFMNFFDEMNTNLVKQSKYVSFLRVWAATSVSDYMVLYGSNCYNVQYWCNIIFLVL